MVREVYGRTLIYPVDEKAKILCKLTGKKAFTIKDMQLIKVLGFHVTYVLISIPLS